MKKVIILMSSVFCFLPMTYGMEKASDPAGPNKSALVRRSSTDVVIPMSQSGTKPRIGSNVPPLDLKEVIVDTPQDQVESQPGSGALSKTRVRSLKDLSKCVSQKQALTSRATSRRAGSSGTNRRPMLRKRLDLVDAGDESPVGSGVKILPTDETGSAGMKKVPSLLPHILARNSPRADLIDEKKFKDEEYMWNFLKVVNNPLYEFACKHDLNLEEVEEYAILIEELDIDPSVINEYVHQNAAEATQTSLLNKGLNYLWGDAKKQNMEHLAKKYEQIKKENPDNYKHMVLEVMKAAADIEAGGQPGRSTIADTHTQLQNAQINDQAAQIRLAYLGLLVTVFTAVGGWAFGAVGQLINPSNCTS